MRLLSRWQPGAVVILVAACVATAVAPANGAVRWSDFYKGELAQNKWASHTAPNQARYNGASAKAWYGAGSGTNSVNAYINGAGQNSVSGTGSVKIYFPYQTGTFKCKWVYNGGGGKGPMHCRLRYGA